MIGPEEYISFIGEEYLRGFIRDGGATVKFVVPQEGASAKRVHDLLSAESNAAGFTYVLVNAKDTKMHMIDQVFHAIARQLDWTGMAETFVRNVFSEEGFVLPEPGRQLSYQAISELNGDYDVRELRILLARLLQKNILRDNLMAHEFRNAMMRLCTTRVENSESSEQMAKDIIPWLRGEIRRMADLKRADIFQRIARHNARYMLASAAHWMQRTGHGGLVLDLDISNFAVAKRPAEPDGLYYTRSAVMDAYEVLRQLIDSTDELTSCFTLVVAAPEFLSDESRGLAVYDALRLRIWDEVRDRRRVNPLSALVRLTPSPAGGS